MNGTECQKCQSPNCSSCDEDLAACSLCLDPYYFSETTKKCEQASRAGRGYPSSVQHLLDTWGGGVHKDRVSNGGTNAR